MMQAVQRLQQWHMVGWEKDCKDLRTTRLYGDRYVHLNKQLALDRCPHRGASLSKGSVADGCVVCPYHGRSFSSETNPGMFTGVVKDGALWFGGQDPDDIPRIPEFDDPSYRTVTMSRRLRRVNAMAFLESSVDYEHINLVHSVSIMDLIALKVKISEEDESAQDSAPSVCLSRFESPRIVLEIDTFFWLPLTNCLRFRIYDKKNDKAWQPFVLFFSTTPHDDDDITLHVRSMRTKANRLLDPVLDVLFRAISDTPILEDATVVRGVEYKGFRDDILSVQDGMVQLYRKRMQKTCPQLVEYFAK
jgi:hypothetical protein